MTYDEDRNSRLNPMRKRIGDAGPLSETALEIWAIHFDLDFGSRRKRTRLFES